MSKDWTEHVGSFDAQHVDGSSVTIRIFQDKIELRSGTSVLDGLKSLQTADGDHVTRIEKGVYEIVSVLGNVRVTSSDPKAP